MNVIEKNNNNKQKMQVLHFRETLTQRVQIP